MKAILFTAAVSIGLMAAADLSKAQAEVTYSFRSPGPDFVYDSANYITAHLLLSPSDLSSDNFVPGQVASVEFTPNLFPTVTINFTSTPCIADIAPFCNFPFPGSGFTAAGSYASTSSYGTTGIAPTLTVSVQDVGSSPAAVPEPASLALLGAGLIGLAAAVTRSRSTG